MPLKSRKSHNSLSLQVIDPVADPAWQALLGTCPTAGLFHSQPWIRTVSEGYGFRIQAYLATTSTGAPAGAVAFCEIQDFFGRRIVSLPFSDTCDPLITSVDAWRGLLATLQSHEIPVHLRCLEEHRVSTTGQVKIVKTARWHRLHLEDSIENLWRRISPEARRAIRRSERAAVNIRPLKGEPDLAAFHQMHVALRKSKYRLLAQPRHFFEVLEKRFQEIGSWHSLAAYLGPRMIAGVIYLRWDDTLYFKFNASAEDALNVRPNNLLVWEGVRLAKLLGCRYLDLGPSDIDQPGLIRFKRGFGAEESELRFLRWVPEHWEYCPERREVLTNITHHMTDPAISNELAAAAGSAFYRFFA